MIHVLTSIQQLRHTLTLRNLQLNDHGHMLSSCLDYVLNSTYNLNKSWIVSVNLMGTIWSEDDIERGVCLSSCIYRLYYTYRYTISIDARIY